MEYSPKLSRRRFSQKLLFIQRLENQETLVLFAKNIKKYNLLKYYKVRLNPGILVKKINQKKEEWTNDIDYRGILGCVTANLEE